MYVFHRYDRVKSVYCDEMKLMHTWQCQEKVMVVED